MSIWYAEQLKTIANRLNEHELLWAVGGSVLLELSGIEVNPRDLDLLVAIGDVHKAAACLEALGAVRQPDEHEGDGTYLTEVFYRYLLGTLEIDLLANAKLINERGRAEIRLSSEVNYRRITFMGAEIALSRLEEWEHYYDVLGRPVRVEQIRAFLMKGQ